MKNGKLRMAVVGIALVLLLTGALVVVMSNVSAPSAQAQADQTPTPTVTPTAGTQMLPRTITVVGQGSANVAPDIAQLTIGVEIVTTTVQVAVMQAGEVMTDVIQALRAEGVAEADIQTTGFNIYMERFFPQGQPGGQEQIRYHVSNNVQVTVRNLDTIGDVLNAAIEAGANNIFGVNFMVEDFADAERQALDEALQDAQEKAEYLASLVPGIEVGPVISISQVIGQGPALSLRQAADGIGGGPIQPGQLEISRQLQVVYAIQ